MKTTTTFLLLAAIVISWSCNDRNANISEPETQAEQSALNKAYATTSLATGDWTPGTLPSTIISPNLLKPLTGNLAGSKIWKSNNPEVVKGNGWLMLNSRTDATRGGSAYAVTGTTPVYLFHINKSGTTRYMHVLVTNPQSSTVTVSGKGSMYTNAEKPLSGSATGQSYWVSRDWLLNTPRTTFSSVQINSGKAYQIYRATLSNGNMVDGRFELTSSAGVYVYTVVTSTGSTTDAITLSQGGPAAGDIYPPSTNAYGREAGVYANSEWTGTTVIDVPATTAYMGLCLNTNSKFAVNGVYLQDQTAPFSMKLNDSAEKTYGNYGHKYTMTLKLQNPNATAKTVSLYFASNFTSTTNSPSFTYNGMILLNGTQKNVWTTPTQPRQSLATWSIPANGYFNATLAFYIPGLITTGQQLMLQAN